MAILMGRWIYMYIYMYMDRLVALRARLVERGQEHRGHALASVETCPFGFISLAR